MKTWNEMSSRERDTLVAEKLFGWQERPCDFEETGGELTLSTDGDIGIFASCPRCGAHGHHSNFQHDLIPPAPYTTSMDAAWQVLQHLAARYNPESRYDYEPFNRLTDTLLGDREEIYPSHDCMYEIVKWRPEAICLAALRAMGYEIEEDLVKREQIGEYANRLLAHYGQRRWDDETRLRLAIYGTTADIYRVEAHFSHINGPMIYETDSGKRDAYQRVADWLMSEQIQRVLVYKNSQVQQTIVVDNPQKEKETPDGTNKETQHEG